MPADKAVSNPMTEDQIKHMVDRFLSWRLPQNLNPDCGISATRPNYAPNVEWTPTGTNLFDATQTDAMVRHMLEGLPGTRAVASDHVRDEPVAPVQCCRGLAPLAECQCARQSQDDVFLRKLVDIVWNEATESTTVPSTNWANKLIKRARDATALPSPDRPASDQGAVRETIAQIIAGDIFLIPDDRVGPATKAAREAAFIRADAILALSTPAIGTPVAREALPENDFDEYPYDDERFNKGVDHVVDLLAKTIGATNFCAGDGSEDYDQDLSQTLLNILAAKELYDPDTGRYAALALPAPGQRGES